MEFCSRSQVRLSTARYRAFGAQTMPRTVSRNLNGDDVSNSKKYRSTFDRYLRYFFRCRLFSTILVCPRVITRSLRKMQEKSQKRGIYALLTSKKFGGRVLWKTAVHKTNKLGCASWQKLVPDPQSVCFGLCAPHSTVVRKCGY